MQYVYNLSPKIVFVLGGLNDIFNWTPVDKIYKDYIKLIEDIKSKNIIPVIQSTTYAGKNWGKDWLAANRPSVDAAQNNADRNREVDKLNLLLSNYAKTNNIDYIDLNAQVKQGNYLNSEVTHDGVHFNSKGYVIWATAIEKILNKYNL